MLENLGELRRGHSAALRRSERKQKRCWPFRRACPASSDPRRGCLLFLEKTTKFRGRFLFWAVAWLQAIIKFASGRTWHNATMGTESCQVLSQVSVLHPTTRDKPKSMLVNSIIKKYVGYDAATVLQYK